MCAQEEDVEGTGLGDAQIVQLFWSTLMLELVMLAVMHSPSSDGAIQVRVTPYPALAA